ncbi:MAG: Bro-N domain-containing protein [Paludibacteraceae bacterium]|nr:Bro-N domain-containing protein [Paludibacteraceae bacterium]
MAQEEIIKQFEAQQVRVVWDDEQEKYFFSIVDVIRVLTESADYQTARKYWNKVKQRLVEEGNEPVTNCHQLKMTAADGKQRLTDVADTEQLLRLIQSVPSKKAEPIKMWLAQVGQERLNQMQDPERSLQQMVADYRRLGYSESWINQRIKSIEIRKGLTDEWQRGGIHDDKQFALLTDIITREWSGMTTREYKQHKDLRKESLRDNMTNIELMLNGLAEATATEISQQENPVGMAANAQVAKRGGKVAKDARQSVEKELGHSVVSSKKAIDYIQPKDELPFSKKSK